MNVRHQDRLRDRCRVGCTVLLTLDDGRHPDLREKPNVSNMAFATRPRTADLEGLDEINRQNMGVELRACSFERATMVLAEFS